MLFIALIPPLFILHAWVPRTRSVKPQNLATIVFPPMSFGAGGLRGGLGDGFCAIGGHISGIPTVDQILTNASSGGAGNTLGLGSVSLYQSSLYTPQGYAPANLNDLLPRRNPTMERWITIPDQPRRGGAGIPVDRTAMSPVKYDPPSLGQRALQYCTRKLKGFLVDTAAKFVCDQFGVADVYEAVKTYSSGWGLLFYCAQLGVDEGPMLQKEGEAHKMIIIDVSSPFDVPLGESILQTSEPPRKFIIVDAFHSSGALSKHVGGGISSSCNDFDTQLRLFNLRRTGGDLDVEKHLFRRDGDYLSTFIRETLQPQYSTSGARVMAEMKLKYGLPLDSGDLAALWHEDVCQKEW